MEDCARCRKFSVRLNACLPTKSAQPFVFRFYALRTALLPPPVAFPHLCPSGRHFPTPHRGRLGPCSTLHVLVCFSFRIAGCPNGWVFSREFFRGNYFISKSFFARFGGCAIFVPIKLVFRHRILHFGGHKLLRIHLTGPQKSFPPPASQHCDSKNYNCSIGGGGAQFHGPGRGGLETRPV